MGADIVDGCIKTPPLELSSVDGRAHARQTADGYGIELSCDAGDGRGPALVVRIEPAQGVLTLSVPEGDLRLSAPSGRVAIDARDVKVEARGDIEQRAGGCVRTDADEIAARASAGRARYETFNLHADSLDAKASEASWTVGKWRLRAGWIRERAVHVMREAEQTFEQRARRMRMVAGGLFQVLSGRTAMRSKDNTSIDGKRVLLG